MMTLLVLRFSIVKLAIILKSGNLNYVSHILRDTYGARNSKNS
ncbi:hypothetical protein SAMN02745781_04065 [Vibrio gazogenes DSM 21264]|uniref:Uncharacterized protein n=1 Tax=Vibrio gazogenes DSM 21264 = NBRC 103151 TaxID=1123492 RepID=A0A1M5HCL2_VIBGA|nr:hypothetical protein SAMN02745781_04065 [Vibrio gazogenes DSM 21264] [Vibrio gazogenes DSM 21264 = NBRC 103151]